MDHMECRAKVSLVLLFGVAAAYFEAAVVVYLREMYYPSGFSFPLETIPRNILAIEFFRELASIVMLVAVSCIAGRKYWERFGYFIILFGTWDMFYYVWLKVTIGWPLTLLDWDILFLIPVPWIGPVVAPVSVSLLMVVAGIAIVRLFARGYSFRPTRLAWALSIAATAAILYTFMKDIDTTFHQQMPQAYLYELLIAGLLLYVAALLLSYRRTVRGNPAHGCGTP